MIEGNIPEGLTFHDVLLLPGRSAVLPAEVDTLTMESRRTPGLFLAGEMLDVDGRIGGFNFQWAWSSAWVAAGGLVREL